MHRLITKNHFDPKDFPDFSELKETYFYSSLSKIYEQEYWSKPLNDSCLILETNQRVVGIVPLAPTQDCLSYFKKPLRIFWLKDTPISDRFELCQLVTKHLEQTFLADEFSEMIFMPEGYLTSSFQSNNLVCENIQEAIINLHLSEELIKRGIRKSYRSLINWGLRELTIVEIDSVNIDPNKFEDFRNFHILVSGKETRSKRSWDIQYQMIQENEAYLILGYLGDKLVSGALTLHGQSEAFYGVGVNDRSLMAEGVAVGHAVILKSILKAKVLGLSNYNLGMVAPFQSGTKDAEIAKFKSGFSSEIRLLSRFKVKKS